MTKKLTDRNVAEICGLLDGWGGPLTWELLIGGVKGLLGVNYTRQALSAHDRIATAYRVRKNILASMPIAAPRGSVEMVAAQDRIARLEAKVARLEEENARLIEKFVRWAYNASLRSLDEAFLDSQLPSVDRERTKLPTAVKSASKP